MTLGLYPASRILSSMNQSYESMSTESRSKCVFTWNSLKSWTMLSGQNITFFRFILGSS